MGKSSPFLYVKNRSGQFVRIQPKTKKTERKRTTASQREINKQKRINKPPVKKQIVRREKPIKVGMVALDELDRAILESQVKTPEEASERFKILLQQAESRMNRSIPAKLNASAYPEALEKYRNRLPMVI
ncbi:MAG: hypothetical protein ABIG40_02470 [Parcubacteria group bacterium]